MDGNGRWAVTRGLSRNLGHKQGAKVFEQVVEHAQAVGVSYLTAYVFSTENWKRPASEVDAIMQLLRSYLSSVKKHTKKNMRVVVLGERGFLPQDIRTSIDDVEKQSSSNTGLTINLAISYGGRAEIISAVKKIAVDYTKGIINNIDAISEDTFASYLYTANAPEVDLVIRTGGELRVSNFLLWQCAYAEYVFSPVLWPDFTAEQFDSAIAEYQKRKRRMGGI